MNIIISPFLSSLPSTGEYAKLSVNGISLNPYSNFMKQASLFSWNLNFGKMKKFAQGHIAHKQQCPGVKFPHFSLHKLLHGLGSCINEGQLKFTVYCWKVSSPWKVAMSQYMQLSQNGFSNTITTTHISVVKRSALFLQNQVCAAELNSRGSNHTTLHLFFTEPGL